MYFTLYTDIIHCQSQSWEQVVSGCSDTDFNFAMVSLAVWCELLCWDI